MGTPERSLILERRFALALDAWGTAPPEAFLDLPQWDCELCGGPRGWGAQSSYRWPEGLHRCDVKCANGWHFICFPCVAKHELTELDESRVGLAFRLQSCPDALRVAEALMGRTKPNCETCQDEGIVEVGGLIEGDPAKMAACGECVAGERVLEESRP